MSRHLNVVIGSREAEAETNTWRLQLGTGQIQVFNLQSLLPLDSEALHHVRKTTATNRTDSGQARDAQKCYESKSGS